MAIVEELTGNIARRIVVDNELVFPNVQTCVAIVARLHGSIAGAHATISDKDRMTKIAAAMSEALGGVEQFYVVGPVDGYNLMPLLNEAPVKFCRTEAFIDVRAVSNGGGLEFAKSHDGGGSWKPIDNAEFS